MTGLGQSTRGLDYPHMGRLRPVLGTVPQAVEECPAALPRGSDVHALRPAHAKQRRRASDAPSTAPTLVPAAEP